MAIAACDVLLIRTGHHTLSTHIRRNRWLRCAVIYLAAHLLVDMPLDPLHWLGVRLGTPT